MRAANEDEAVPMFFVGCSIVMAVGSLLTARLSDNGTVKEPNESEAESKV